MRSDFSKAPDVRERARPSIVQYWDADEPPDYIVDICATFRDRNPDFDHQLFSAVDAADFIGENLGERERFAFEACAIPAVQSDYFSCCAVQILGGVYSDVDFRCVAPLDSLLAESSGELFRGPVPYALNGLSVYPVQNGIFAFRDPDHPAPTLAVEIATANIEARIAEHAPPGTHERAMSIFLTAGPGVWTLMRILFELGSFDAFRKAVKDTLVEPYGEICCATVDRYQRVASAFEGVRVRPHFGGASPFVGGPRSPLAYKQTTVHWPNFKGPIFR